MSEKLGNQVLYIRIAISSLVFLSDTDRKIYSSQLLPNMVENSSLRAFSYEKHCQLRLAFLAGLLYRRPSETTDQSQIQVNEL